MTNRVLPDDAEQLIQDDPSSGKSSTSEDEQRTSEEVVSPSDVKNSLSEVARSPYLARKTVDKWLKYHKIRRGAADSIKDTHATHGLLSREASRIKNSASISRQREKANRKLIEYFCKVNEEKRTEIDLHYLYDLIHERNADINTTDIYGQTIMHEIAHDWHTDVAQFFIENGGNINLPDFYGRTPLHVAASENYPEMCSFLIDNGASVDSVTKHDPRRIANVDVKTPEQRQTPLHFAAAHDAKDCCEILIDRGADIEARDFRQRTPLFVAAELDRSDSAKYLIEQKADARAKDSSGNMVLSAMISKMPEVASEALEQLSHYNRRHRKQIHYINEVVPSPEEIQMESKDQIKARHPLEVIVREGKTDIIKHPLIEKLVSILWKRHGKRHAQLDAIFTVLMIICWTVVAVSVPYNERFIYEYPGDWWRVLVFLLAAGFTVAMITVEVSEFRKSRRKLEEFKKWREAQVRRDIDYCHPMRPHERDYIDEEINCITSEKLYYWNGWNVYDWVVILMLFITILLHIIPVAIYNIHPHIESEIGDENDVETAEVNGIEVIRINGTIELSCEGGVSQDTCDQIVSLNRSQNYVFAITIIVLFFRLLKAVRMTSLMGPFIVILSSMIYDVIRFGILIFIVFAGYYFAFWMVWDGRILGLEGAETFDEMGFMLFRLMLVDEWPYDDMMGESKLMTYLLVGSYLALVAILFINLYIALLSDTFQRIYDNATLNAAMQRATFVMEVWSGLDVDDNLELLEFLNSNECNPYTEPWDDDANTDRQDAVKRMTHQIFDKICHLDDYIREEEEEEETLEMKSKKLLVNRSELVDLSATLKIMKTEMDRNNRELSQRLEIIENHVNKLRKRPKPSQLDTKKSMHLPSLINYDLQTTIESVAETVENIYGPGAAVTLPTVANTTMDESNA